jgi:hypothetical protein
MPPKNLFSEVDNIFLHLIIVLRFFTVRLFIHFFSVFWDLYCAAPERRETCDHSSEAKAFHDYVSLPMHDCEKKYLSLNIIMNSTVKLSSVCSIQEQIFITFYHDNNNDDKYILQGNVIFPYMVHDNILKR